MVEHLVIARLRGLNQILLVLREQVVDFTLHLHQVAVTDQVAIEVSE